MELMGGLNTVAYGKQEGGPTTEIPPRKRSRWSQSREGHSIHCRVNNASAGFHTRAGERPSTAAVAPADLQGDVCSEAV